MFMFIFLLNFGFLQQYWNGWYRNRCFQSLFLESYTQLKGASFKISLGFDSKNVNILATLIEYSLKKQTLKYNK